MDHQPATYTQYLQGLLKQHKIEFQLEGEYLSGNLPVLK